MSRLPKTFLKMEVTDTEYTVKYNGTLSCPQTKEQRKHNERLMRTLYENEDILNFLYNIVTPIVRLKRREARKKQTFSAE